MEITGYLMNWVGERYGRTVAEEREIVIPEDQLRGDETFNDILNLVSMYSQNDFQPRDCPSMSPGDVVGIRDGEDAPIRYWRMCPAGWEVEDDVSAKIYKGYDAADRARKLMGWD